MYLVFQRIEKIIYEILSFLVSLGIVILLILVTFKIISRYFNIQLLAPPDEIITLVYVWMLFIGSALLVRKIDDHIKIEILDKYLQSHPFIKKVYDILICLLILLFLIVMTKSSLILYEQSGNRSSPMLQLPQRLWYLPLPISSFLMVFYLLIRVGKNIYKLVKQH